MQDESPGGPIVLSGSFWEKPRKLCKRMCCLAVPSTLSGGFWKNSRNPNRNHEIVEFKHNQYSTYHAIHINYIKTNNNSHNLVILAPIATLKLAL